ncbi:MAG TPA: class II histone deacetylase [Thermomicrobiales bacterium]|nr:class II histone deacetylase [Thermomicrobiales bacterium]
MEHPRDRKVGLGFDDRYLQHNSGEFLIEYRDRYPYAEPVPHLSSPAVLGRAKHLIDLYGLSRLMEPIGTREATDEELALYHTESHIQRVREIGKTGGDTGTGAPIGPRGDVIARLAVGGVIEGVAAVMRGDVHHALCLVRPPGHHAMSDHGMGFCTFNNVAIGAKVARQLGARRITIFDWDVHHGNGTQDAFWEDPDVLFISIHQEDLFPPVGWGSIDQRGEGAGEGTTINIPLPAGSGNPSYLAAMEETVVPAIRAFGPDLIMVSAGQDASVMDPLGRMSLTTASYRVMTSMLRELADDICESRMVIALEGGYSEIYAPFCTAAIAEGLVTGIGGFDPVREPYGSRAETMPATRRVGKDARTALDAAQEAHADLLADAPIEPSTVDDSGSTVPR